MKTQPKPRPTVKAILDEPVTLSVECLVQSGLIPEIESILPALNVQPANPKGSAEYLREIAQSLRGAKGAYPDLLVHALRRNGADAARVPVFFKELLDAIVNKVS